MAGQPDVAVMKDALPEKLSEAEIIQLNTKAEQEIKMSKKKSEGEQGGKETNMHKRIAMGEKVTGMKEGGKACAMKKGGKVKK
jgi:hypothetical protein